MATHSCEAECTVHLKVKVILKLSHTECNVSKLNIVATYVIWHNHLKCSCDWQSANLIVYCHQRLGRHLLHEYFPCLTKIWQRTKIEQKWQIELKFGQVYDSNLYSIPYTCRVCPVTALWLLLQACTCGMQYILPCVCWPMLMYTHGGMYCHVCVLTNAYIFVTRQR